jgi:hypothetical protein
LCSEEKLYALAEEMGHAKLTAGNIIDQAGIGNMKQEHKARCWAYRKLVSPEDICNAAENGCHEIYEFAEALDLPEDFLQECVAYYKGSDAIGLPKDADLGE